MTTWGPATATNGLHEYAFKLWNGLVAEYYGARWQLFVSAMAEALSSGQPLDEAGFAHDMYAFETAFVDTATPFAAVPAGDAVAVSQLLRAK